MTRPWADASCWAGCDPEGSALKAEVDWPYVSVPDGSCFAGERVEEAEDEADLRAVARPIVPSGGSGAGFQVLHLSRFKRRPQAASSSGGVKCRA